MTTEEKIEKISKLEANYEAMAAEIEKLKAELTKKDKNETVWIPEIYNTYMCIDSFGYVYSTILEDTSSEKQRIDFNNVYQSNNKTQTHLKWYANNVLRVQNKLMQLHELLCPDYFPDLIGIQMNVNGLCIMIIIISVLYAHYVICTIILLFISPKKQQKRLVKFSIEKNL